MSNIELGKFNLIQQGRTSGKVTNPIYFSNDMKAFQELYYIQFATSSSDSTDTEKTPIEEIKDGGKIS